MEMFDHANSTKERSVFEANCPANLRVFPEKIAQWRDMLLQNSNEPEEYHQEITEKIPESVVEYTTAIEHPNNDIRTMKFREKTLIPSSRRGVSARVIISPSAAKMTSKEEGKPVSSVTECTKKRQAESQQVARKVDGRTSNTSVQRMSKIAKPLATKNIYPLKQEVDKHGQKVVSTNVSDTTETRKMDPLSIKIPKRKVSTSTTTTDNMTSCLALSSPLHGYPNYQTEFNTVDSFNPPAARKRRQQCSSPLPVRKKKSRVMDSTDNSSTPPSANKSSRCNMAETSPTPSSFNKSRNVKSTSDSTTTTTIRKRRERKRSSSSPTLTKKEKAPSTTDILAEGATLDTLTQLIKNLETSKKQLAAEKRVLENKQKTWEAEKRDMMDDKKQWEKEKCAILKEKEGWEKKDQSLTHGMQIANLKVAVWADTAVLKVLEMEGGEEAKVRRDLEEEVEGWVRRAVESEYQD